MPELAHADRSTIMSPFSSLDELFSAAAVSSLTLEGPRLLTDSYFI